MHCSMPNMSQVSQRALLDLAYPTIDYSLSGRAVQNALINATPYGNIELEAVRTGPATEAIRLCATCARVIDTAIAGGNVFAKA